MYRSQDGGLLVALGYPALSAEPAEREMYWVRGPGCSSRPSGHRPWEHPLERSVTVPWVGQAHCKWTGKPRVSYLPYSVFAQLPPGFTIFGARGPWREEFQSLLSCLAADEGALSTEEADPGRLSHFEVRGPLRVCSLQAVRVNTCWAQLRECLAEGVQLWDRGLLALIVRLPCSPEWWPCKASKSQTSDFCRPDWLSGALGMQVSKYSQIEESVLVLFSSLEASVGCILSLGLLHSFIQIVTCSWVNGHMLRVTKFSGVLILLLYSHSPIKLRDTQKQGPSVLFPQHLAQCLAPDP